MFSIFSTQNLQTFLRRKNLRPPSRGGPPGPRPPPPPPNRGRSPPERSPPPLGRRSSDGDAALGSSAIILLHLSCKLFIAGVSPGWCESQLTRENPTPLQQEQQVHLLPQAPPLVLPLLQRQPPPAPCLSSPPPAPLCSLPNA